MNSEGLGLYSKPPVYHLVLLDCTSVVLKEVILRKVVIHHVLVVEIVYSFVFVG